MRVLFFSRDYTTHDRRFLLKLAESRHEIFYLRLEDDGVRYERNPLPDGVNLVEWAGGKNAVHECGGLLALMPSFESVLERIRPQLIHAGPIQTCGFMTALSGFHPFIAMSWGSDILVHADRDEAANWMTKRTLRESDYFVCDCRPVRDRVRQLVSYADERIVQFPWGIDLERYPANRERGTLRDELGWSDAFAILSTRSWEPIYGIDVLLKAFLRAYRERSNLRLLLLGTGSLAPGIEGFIRDNGLDRVVHRPGIVAQDRIPDYFHAVDLYVSCTKSDGTSISLLEAMAASLPVLLTDAEGNREWAAPGANGWLVRAEDAEGFARAMLEAGQMDSAARDAIGRRNRRVIEERADWNANVKKLIELYDRIEAGIQ